MMEALKTIRHASSLILIQRAQGGFEVLLLERNPDLSYLGGAWVFPGGQIEPGDYGKSSGRRPESAAIQAAVRETREECGLNPEPERLVYFSHWLTPLGLPRRYATHYFISPFPGGSVRVDGGEIHSHRWMRPHEALDAHRTGEMLLPPPVFVSLIHLSRYLDGSSVISSVKKVIPPRFRPRLVPVIGGFCSLYQDDGAYEHGGLERPGKRHRLWMLSSGWMYEGYPSSSTV